MSFQSVLPSPIGTVRSRFSRVVEAAVGFVFVGMLAFLLAFSLQLFEVVPANIAYGLLAPGIPLLVKRTAGKQIESLLIEARGGAHYATAVTDKGSMRLSQPSRGGAWEAAILRAYVARGLCGIDGAEEQETQRRQKDAHESKLREEAKQSQRAAPPPTSSQKPAPPSSSPKSAPTSSSQKPAPPKPARTHSPARTIAVADDAGVPFCPRCAVGLTRVGGPLDAYRCSRCEGRHLPPEGAERLVEQELNIDRALLREIAAQFLGKTLGKTLPCPSCGGVMRETMLKGEQVDLCHGCGSLWLDAGELARISQGRDGEPVPNAAV